MVLLTAVGWGGARPADAASGYTLVAGYGTGITTSDKAIKLTVTYRKSGKAVAKATVRLEYLKGTTWVTEKKVTVKKGKGSTSVKHAPMTRTYRFSVAGKATSEPFTVRFVPAAFVLSGSGFGHGVGMAQWGAYQLSREGATAADILSYYYPGAIPSAANNPSGKIRVQVLGPPADSRTTTDIAITSGGFAVLDRDGATLAGYSSPGTIRIGVSGTQVTATVTLKNGKVKKKKLPTGPGYQVTWTAGPVTVAGAQGSYNFGRLIVSNLQQRPNVVNELVMNTEYLYGVDEMPSAWGTAAKKGQQALRAQVVAARTYALTRIIRLNPAGGSANVLAACGCHVFDDTRSQNFTGWRKTSGAANQPWVQAVDATVRSVAVTPGRPDGSEVDVLRDSTGGFAETVYFSSSGSYTVAGTAYSGTAANADAFGTAALAYLAHVEDPYSARAPGNPYLSWSRSITQAKARQLFATGEPVVKVAVTSRYPGGLARSLEATTVTGQTVELTRTADSWRSALGVPGSWITSVVAK